MFQANLESIIPGDEVYFVVFTIFSNDGHL